VESIGEKLRSVRESKKISIKDVANETNINPVYLRALEDENFDKFPSETYLVGFLKSYADYLKLDKDEMVASYKGYKIGESVTPLEELTRPTGNSLFPLLIEFLDRYKNYLFISMGVVAFIIIAVVLKGVFTSNVDINNSNSISDIKKAYNDKQKNSIETIRAIQLTNNKGIVLLYANEAVQFLVDSKEVVFLLQSIDAKSKQVTLGFLSGKSKIILLLDDTKKIKIDGASRDIFLTLKGLTNSRAKLSVQLGNPDKEKEALVKKQNKILDETVSTDVVAQNRKSLKIIFEAQFYQKSFIEVYLDGVKKQRGFLPAGTHERWEANENIQIKVGNAGGLKAIINGKVFKFGRMGEVANKVIKWKRDSLNPNLYHIVVQDW